jgi:hypothetical protein
MLHARPTHVLSVSCKIHALSPRQFHPSDTLQQLSHAHLRQSWNLPSFSKTLCPRHSCSTDRDAACLSSLQQPRHASYKQTGDVSWKLDVNATMYGSAHRRFQPILERQQQRALLINCSIHWSCIQVKQIQVALALTQCRRVLACTVSQSCALNVLALEGKLHRCAEMAYHLSGRLLKTPRAARKLRPC